LGHQSIAGSLRWQGRASARAKAWQSLMDWHDGSALFKDVQNPFQATRYHSLIVERQTLPNLLNVTAWTDDGLIMAIACEEKKLYGVQFHPESIMTTEGKKMLKNFLEL
jgi:anthranilate synthase, component II (EC 4.1.3.27)